MWVGTNARRTAPFAQERYDVSGGQLVETQILANSATALGSGWGRQLGPVRRRGGGT